MLNISSMGSSRSGITVRWLKRCGGGSVLVGGNRKTSLTIYTQLNKTRAMGGKKHWLELARLVAIDKDRKSILYIIALYSRTVCYLDYLRGFLGGGRMYILSTRSWTSPVLPSTKVQWGQSSRRRSWKTGNLWITVMQIYSRGVDANVRTIAIVKWLEMMGDPSRAYKRALRRGWKSDNTHFERRRIHDWARQDCVGMDRYVRGGGFGGGRGMDIILG